MNDTQKDTILQEIIHADLRGLFNLIEPLKDETPELELAYNTLKQGIKIKYHIEWNLQGHAEIRERNKIVLLKGNKYPIEEWWDEEENRRSIARKALLEYYSDEEKPYEER